MGTPGGPGMIWGAYGEKNRLHLHSSNWITITLTCLQNVKKPDWLSDYCRMITCNWLINNQYDTFFMLFTRWLYQWRQFSLRVPIHVSDLSCSMIIWLYILKLREVAPASQMATATRTLYTCYTIYFFSVQMQLTTFQSAKKQSIWKRTTHWMICCMIWSEYLFT